MSHRVPVRWRDLDALGHVHHAAILTLFEEGRDAWLASHGIALDTYVVGRCSVEYVDEARLGIHAVDVHCEVSRIGRKSITTRERLTDETGRLVAQAEFDLVLWDPARRRSRPIADAERASLSDTPGGAS